VPAWLWAGKIANTAKESRAQELNKAKTTLTKISFNYLLQVGKNVAGIAIGDRVGVGTISDCCMECGECDLVSSKQ
jgi:hypothetical protein